MHPIADKLRAQIALNRCGEVNKVPDDSCRYSYAIKYGDLSFADEIYYKSNFKSKKPLPEQLNKLHNLRMTENAMYVIQYLYLEYTKLWKSVLYK